MELLEYWKEFLTGLSIIAGTLAIISEKFRDTITFWKTRKSESQKTDLELKNSNLDYVERYQAYMEKELEKLLQKLEEEKEKFNKEIAKADKLVIESEENNRKSKILISRYRTHIKYLEGLLIKSNINFNRLED